MTTMREKFNQRSPNPASEEEVKQTAPRDEAGKFAATERAEKPTEKKETLKLEKKEQEDGTKADEGDKGASSGGVDTSKKQDVAGDKENGGGKGEKKDKEDVDAIVRARKNRKSQSEKIEERVLARTLERISERLETKKDESVATTADEQIPDPVLDRDNFNVWLAKQIKDGATGMVKPIEERFEAMQREGAKQQWQATHRDIASKNEVYAGAAGFLEDKIVNELMERHPQASDTQLRQELDNTMFLLAQQAQAVGIRTPQGIAGFIRSFAEDNGYVYAAPVAAAEEEEEKPAGQALEEKRKLKERTLSLNGVGSRAGKKPAGEMDNTKLGAMSMRDRSKLSKLTYSSETMAVVGKYTWVSTRCGSYNT